MRSVSPTSSLWLPTPAPDWFVPCFSQKLPLLVPSGAGRSSRCVRLAVDVCFAPFNGFSANDGGDAGGEAAQKRTRRFGAKRVCPESAAFAFPPLAGVAPYPLSLPAKRARRGASPAKVVVVSVSLGQHRARSTARAAFGYSLAEGTLQGRCWDTSRRARESISRPEQARVGHHQGHFRDGASGAVGVVGAAVSILRDISRYVAFAKAGSAAKRGAGGTWRCVATRVNRAGPSEARMRRGGAATGVNTPIKRGRESGLRGKTRSTKANRRDRDKHPHRARIANPSSAAKRGKTKTERGTSPDERGKTGKQRGRSADERGKTGIDRGKTRGTWQREAVRRPQPS